MIWVPIATGTPLRVRPRITPIKGAASGTAPIVATTLPASTRLPMLAAALKQPATGA
jgi:hypothetical protein